MMNLCLEAVAFPVAALGYRNERKQIIGVSLLRRELSKAVPSTNHLDERRGSSLEGCRESGKLRSTVQFRHHVHPTTP
jgi:hypothetical protein